MKRSAILILAIMLVAFATPGHSFVNYLFGGSSDNAVGNTVVGDLRAWWTGNPVYQFNPFYSSKGVPQQVVEQPPPSSLNMNPRGGAVVQQSPGGYQYQHSAPYPQANPGPPAPQVYPGQAPQRAYQPRAQYGAPSGQYRQPQPQTVAPPGQQQQYYQRGYQTMQPRGNPLNASYR
jgi:hypothetical protein